MEDIAGGCILSRPLTKCGNTLVVAVKAIISKYCHPTLMTREAPRRRAFFRCLLQAVVWL